MCVRMYVYVNVHTRQNLESVVVLGAPTYVCSEQDINYYLQ